ncbi:putative sensor-like histidine kinase [compost metagenome]
MLQPLVENAILHGMEGKTYGGELLITSWIEDQSTVKIKVQDNGPGMNKERLQYVQNELEHLSQRKYPLFSHDEDSVKDLFGLRNVLTRIKLYYGSKADLSVHSVEGEGTTVTISLPLERCQEEFHLINDHSYDLEGKTS